MKAHLLAPTNEEFNKVFADSITRSVKTETKNNSTVRRGGATVAGGNTSYNVKTIESSAQTASNKQEEITRAYTKEYAEDGSRGVQYAKRLKSRRKYIPSKGKKAISTAYTTAKTVKAATTTYSIYSWAFYIWIWFQVPIAILSLVAMGLQQALYDIFTTENIVYSQDRTLWEKANTVVSDLGSTLLSIFKVVALKFAAYFNIDPNIVGGLFLMTHVTVMIIGWVTLFTALFLYTLSGTHSVFGKKGGIKSGLFILAMIGYSMPIFNLFPWFFLWTLVVVKNPR